MCANQNQFYYWILISLQINLDNNYFNQIKPQQLSLFIIIIVVVESSGHVRLHK